MTSIRNSKRSIPDKRYTYPAFVYVKEIRENWLKTKKRELFPISTGESRMTYRMTLGSIYYDKEIIKIEARESKTEIGNQAVTFLKTEHPTLWRNWVSIRNMTNIQLEYIEKLWKDHILAPVSEILSKLKQQYPHLIKYRDIHDKEFYVEENIIEGVFLEIQHFASLGYRLNLFKIEKKGEVGNGFTFLRSSNKRLIEEFISSINKIIINETVLDKFKLAEVKKTEVEARVYEFKKAIHKIYMEYFEGKKKMMNN